MTQAALRRRLLAFFFAASASALFADSCSAQDSSIPDVSYFSAMEELYRGEYQRAARSFTSEVNSPVRIGQTLWIDSICYRAMRGETYYQMGETRQALDEFNAACELFLTYPRWLLTVEFRQNPRPDANSARRIAPWGRSGRQVTYGTFPDTMLVSQGELITERQLRRGGPIQSLQMWRLNVIEVMRTTALAIRRRNEILGPLGQHDRLSKSLVDALARGGNAPRNHWSNAWTELLLGLAQHGIGESQQALPHISRGVLVDGRFDHPLTGAALLAQAQLALEAGNAQAALNLATEAGYAAYAYDDYDVLGASMELGHRALLAGGGEGIYPPLAPAAEWARREGLSHLSASFWLAEAEELAVAGDLKAANARVGNISARRRDIGGGRLGPIRGYVEALISYSGGNDELANKQINKALRHKRLQSLRNLQTALANERVDNGEISPRIAVDLYGELLRDPTARDWAHEPLETFAHLTSSHESAFGRWLLAALSRKEILPAIDITERAKRRRFWRAQPLGGRMLALAHLLEVHPDRLSPEAKLQRRSLLLAAPAYEALLQQATLLRRELAAEPLVDQAGRTTQEQKRRMKQLEENAAQRETLLRWLALRRVATNFDLPPRRTAAQMQATLQPGRALLIFHQSGSSFYAFLLTADGYHHWRIPEAGPLREQAAEMLREMGHFSQSRTLTASDLAADKPSPEREQFADMLFRESRLDLAKTTELIIVPDGVLWHVPFESLAPSIGGNKESVIDRTPVRYSPTAGFAVGDEFRPRPIKTTGIAGPTGTGSDDFLSQQLVTDIEGSVENPVVLHNPLPAPSPIVASLVEQLVVLQESVLDPSNPYGFDPLPLDRSGQVGNLSAWLTLPRPACERLLLAGLHTVAETGLKSRRRKRDEDPGQIADGSELFHTSCALLTSGAKTVLLARWQTSGQTHRELLREFSLELPHVAASEAWRRSVTLARRNKLDPEQEPRLKRPSESTPIPTADHPFLWSGYLLVDTGYDPAPVAEEAE